MPNFLFFDTETNGLHIITSKPFSMQKGHLKDHPVYLDVNKKNVKIIISELKKPDTWLIGHNIKYDCHMLINIGVPIEIFKDVILIDTMFMARLAIDHDTQAGNKKYRRPPISLALKKLARTYLGVDSAEEELQLKEAFKKLKAKHKIEYKIFLTGLLKKEPTTKQLNRYYQIKETDLIASEFVYDNSIVEKTNEWLKENPYPTYADIPDYILKPYATKDIVLTKGVFLKFYAAIKSKGQLDILVRESKTLYPLLLMEREGLVVDKEQAVSKYKELFETRQKLNVIISPVTVIKEGAKIISTYFENTKPSRKSRVVVQDEETGVYNEYKKSDVLLIKGTRVNTKSSQQMAALYSYETGRDITTANKQTRQEIMDESPSAKKIQLLRPLDKIIDTYLSRIINDSIYVDGQWKLFGTYNNLDDSYNSEDDTAGTVTGRLSSDLQQFPKTPLFNDDGTELINIRRLFTKPKDAYAMMYFDMSQLELRLQTIWSAVIDGEPDPVMARGFGPYNCHKREDKWYLNEEPETEWAPTDFHTATAYEAFGDLPDYEENKSYYRTLGKRANFAIGYGASKWKLVESLKVTETRAQKLIDGWKKAYTGLTHMDNYLRRVTKVTDHQTNLLGRKYYTRNVHKLKNWLVQGSGGDLLKIFLARLVPFVEKYPHWKLMLTVHDEIDFILLKEPSKKEVQEVLDIMYYTAAGIEVTADAEITYKSWADKAEYVL